MIKSILVLLFWFVLVVNSFSQLKNERFNRSLPGRYINRLFFDTISKEKPQFLAYPIVAYSPETSLEVGISSVYVRYAKNDTNNRLSEINTFAFYTLAKQFGILNEHALYSDKNRYFLLGKLKFQSFPLSYWGIGPRTDKDKDAIVDGVQFQFKERFLTKVKGPFYLGLETDFQSLTKIRFEDSVPNLTLPIGSTGSSNFGLGLGFVFDQRHNVLNVRDAFFGEIAYLNYGLISPLNFEIVSMDFRFFHPIRKRNVLAFQAIGQLSKGNVPFNQLGLLGGDMMMRGYYTGRFRDKQLMATQLEYRMLPFSFAKRFGATVFASTGMVAPSIMAFDSRNLKLAGGAGLRFLLFPKKDIYTRIDFAFTNEGNGFYIFIGESF
jgi:hypothetical protein